MKIADTSFNKSKVLYQKSLNNSGFYENVIYQQDNRNKNQHKKIKKRQRKIIWLNPPFSKIMKMNIGKKFFKLVKSHCPKHKMLKTFNKNTIKLSYSYCRNMGSVIASHNWRIIQPTSNNHGCNCRNRAECPLDNKCLTANIIYKVVASAPSKPRKKYFAIAETSFKDRFRNHKKDFCPKSMITALNFLNTCRKWKMKK